MTSGRPIPAGQGDPFAEEGNPTMQRPPIAAGLVAAGLVAAGLLVSGCAAATGSQGSSGDSTASVPPPSASATALAVDSKGSGFNAADVMFAQMMIPHHGQAITMAESAADRAGSARVRALAARIKESQQPEIALMAGWLRTWGAQVPDQNGMAHMGHHGMAGGTGTGMMSDATMQQLAKANGAAFDRLFLESMIGHHRGAVMMAQQEITGGRNKEAVRLARQVVTDQTREIARMRTMLAG
jgi:uncharacterized protein (DUF305 family)